MSRRRARQRRDKRAECHLIDMYEPMTDTTDQFQPLRDALAAKPNPGPHHIYTNPRDDNNWRANDEWHKAASPLRVSALLAEVERLTAELAAARVDAERLRGLLSLPGTVTHDYQGMCPDDQQPLARDPECPACRFLIEAEQARTA